MRLVDVAVPAAGIGEVLVRVGAAGVNFADVMQTRGTYDRGPQPPYLAGFEAAGGGGAGGGEGTVGGVGDHVIGAGDGAVAGDMVVAGGGGVPGPAGGEGGEGRGLSLD